ncbi:MAG: DNA alkylation repair protein [Candidatus Muiribacteriota bacterium]|jgi:3-methyladenine DNA glycosylase AlkD
MTIYEQIAEDLIKSKITDNNKIEKMKSFLQISPEGYGKNDEFLGVKVPVQREIAKKYYKDCDLETMEKLLKSPIHEYRFTALLMLILHFEKEQIYSKKECYNLYVRNMKYINNWDLVDVSSHKIIGSYLFDKNREILLKWACDKNIWIRRISIVSTWYFIRQNDFEYTLKISEKLLSDSHHLIHKAIGWMLREVGKKDQNILNIFLKKQADKMPRVTLRYAIEKYPENIRKKILKNKFIDIL